MERPELPPLVPGRSALPAFLVIERHVRDALADAEARAEESRQSAEEDAARTRRDGEARLKQVVLEAERSAMRASEARERDRVSALRAGVQRWIDQAEREAEEAVDDAIELLVEGGRGREQES